MIVNKSIQRRRHGATLVESAVAYGVILIILIGLLVGGLGVFRYQEVAYLARESARYASVRGVDYQQEVSGATAATPQDVYDNVIVPRATLLDLNNLSYEVTWDQTNAARRVTPDGEVIGNSVTVTVSYQWFPELIFVGPITLTSSSTMPMSY